MLGVLLGIIFHKVKILYQRSLFNQSFFNTPEPKAHKVSL